MLCRNNWKQIKGFEGIYEINRNGDIRNFKTKKNKKPFESYHGYVRIALGKNGTFKNFSVHRLVAETFIKDDFEGNKVVNHINGNKKDNRVENLEWCSYGENNLKAFKEGLRTTKRKSIIKCDVEGNVIQRWSSINRASMDSKIPVRSLSACCEYNDKHKAPKKIKEYIYRYGY